MAAQALQSRPAGGKALIQDAVKGGLAGGLGVIALDQVANFMYRHENPAALAREQAVHATLGTSEMGPVSTGIRQLARKFALELNERHLDKAATVLHYSLGVLPGAAYAVLLDRAPRMGIGRGFLYGLALFAVNDELMSVRLGWAAKPSLYPWQAHARGLAAHLAMGVVTYQALRLLGKIWK
jgi:hypothetical protein